MENVEQLTYSLYQKNPIASFPIFKIVRLWIARFYHKLDMAPRRMLQSDWHVSCRVNLKLNPPNERFHNHKMFGKEWKMLSPSSRNQLILSLILPNHTCENPLVILLLIHPSWIIALALVISRFKIGFTLKK